MSNHFLSQYVDQILQGEEKEKLQDHVLACVMITLRTLERSPHHCIPPPQQKASTAPNITQQHSIFLSTSSAPSRNPSVASMDSGSASVTTNNNRFDFCCCHFDNGVCLVGRWMVTNVRYVTLLSLCMTRRLLRNVCLLCRQPCITCPC